MGLVAAGAQALGQRGELPGRLGGELIRVVPGRSASGCSMTARRMRSGSAGSAAETFEVEAVDDRRRVREVGVDLEAVEVADHQQRRVLERLAVLQELV